MAECSVDDCNTQASVRTWCKKHYSRWYRHGDLNFRKTKPQSGHCIVGDCRRQQKTNNMCGAHQKRAYSPTGARPEVPLRDRAYEQHTRVRGDQGYVRIKISGHPRGGRYGWPLEHIVVMEGMLQRELLLGESVHHRNGIRDDNRPENLELWVVYQPAGQRPEDLVAWAQEVIRRYG